MYLPVLYLEVLQNKGYSVLDKIGMAKSGYHGSWSWGIGFICSTKTIYSLILSY